MVPTFLDHNSFAQLDRPYLTLDRGDARGRTAGEKDSDGPTYSYVMPIRTWSANDKSQKQMLVPGLSVTTKESISRGVLKSTRSVSH